MQFQVKDNEIKIQSEDKLNVEETARLAQSERYRKFMHWCQENGVRTRGVQVPAAFGSLGVTGMCASEDLPANTAIIAVPNRLVIGHRRVRKGELKDLYNANAHMFDATQNPDAEINVLAIFVLYEKLKGENSFFHPYLNLVENSYTLFDWTKFDVAETEQRQLIDEFKYYVDEMMGIWLRFQPIIEANTQLFTDHTSKQRVTRTQFFWAYEMVMTRVFGQSMSSTSLIPFADLMNHHIDTVTHYVVQTSYEKVPSTQCPQYYHQKKQKIDLSLLCDKGEEELHQKGLTFPLTNKRRRYLEKHLNRDLGDGDYCNQQEIKECLYALNTIKLQENAKKELWHLKYYTTSDSEDNDTEEEEEELRERETQLRREREGEQMEYWRSQGKFKEDELYQHPYNPSRAEKKETKAQFLQSSPKSPEAVAAAPSSASCSSSSSPSSSSSSSSSSENEWEWCDPEDNDLYFVVTTHAPLRRGQQIYNHYGRRTNTFLLIWYGFCFANNLYDSYSFRLWMRYEPHSLSEQIFEDIIFQKFVYSKEIFSGNGQKITVSDLTKEFRIKKNRLCVDLLSYLRVYLMQHFIGVEISRIFSTLPVSLKYESFVLNFAIKILKYLRGRFSTSQQQDLQQLQDLEITYKMRFALIMRYTHKEILDAQISLLQSAQNIVGRLQQGHSLKESYLENFEGTQNLLEERHKLKAYLMQLAESIRRKVLFCKG